MKHPVLLPLTLLVTAALACNNLAPQPTETPVPPTTTALPSATPAPTLTATPVLPTPTAFPTATPGRAFNGDLYIGEGDVLVHPDPQVYAGDQVSFEVSVHDGAGLGLNRFPVALYLGDPKDGHLLDTAQAFPSGLGGRLQATFTWTWTAEELTGEQTLTAVVDPDDVIQIGDENPNNNTLTFTLSILPRDSLTPIESEAHWVTTESDCCIFNYISGSAAERDIDMIKATADNAVQYVEGRMNKDLQQKMVFNLIDRLLGHGGFASTTITITYIDRDYAGGGIESVFRHEATHLLDRQFGNFRPSIIEEGTATFVAGGHFKEEPFEPRLIGVIDLGQYIPLTELANHFYNSQHEIGYLEGAAFIEYLVNNYGWDRYTHFLGSFQSGPTDSMVLDAALRLIYDRSLAEMETDWLAKLKAEPVDARWRSDVDYTVQYYDTVRRYQQINDPSAYFLTAWIPDITRAVRDNIVADYSRHPDSPTNIALETMLVEASHTIADGDFESTHNYLRAVNAVLDSNGDFSVDPLATDYWTLTESALGAGYEPHRIQLDANGDTATLTVSQPFLPATLSTLTLTRSGEAWRLN